MTSKQNWLLILSIVVAGWLQASWSSHIAILHSSPDFLMTLLVCLSLILGTVNATLYNVWATFLTCTLAGVNYGSILASRVLTGALAGSLRQHVIEDSPIVPLITVFLATWICESIYFIMAPNLHALRWWVRMVWGESLYNSAISIPVYFGLRWIGIGNDVQNGSNPFYDTVI